MRKPMGENQIFDHGLAGLKAMKAHLVLPHQSFNLKDMVDLSFCISSNMWSKGQLTRVIEMAVMVLHIPKYRLVP